MKRNNHNALPMSFTGWDEAGDFGDILFHNCEFWRDFGEIKRGSSFDSVIVWDAKAKLVAQDAQGNEISMSIHYEPGEQN